MTWSLHPGWQGALRTRLARAVVWFVSVIAATAAPTPPSLEHAQWIWSPEPSSACHLRTVFKVDAAPASAVILITADNGYDLSVNGARVGGDAGAATEVWQSVERSDITSRLVKGWNSLGVLATDLGGERGLIAAVRLEWPDGRVEERVTDGGWHATASEPPVDCSHPEFVEGPEWALARASWGAL